MKPAFVFDYRDGLIHYRLYAGAAWSYRPCGQFYATLVHVINNPCDEESPVTKEPTCVVCATLVM